MTLRAALLTACLAVAGALAAGPAAAQAPPPVLGAPELMGPEGSGWGTVAPGGIFNGGVPSGMVDGITWTGWGAPVATGRGQKPAYKPRGGYYREEVATRLRASRLATCPGSAAPAYTRLTYSFRVRPGGPWSAWFPWTLDLCDLGARPDGCGRLAGVRKITAWDASCATARRIARDARRIDVRPGRGPAGEASYLLRTRGFRCAGVSFSRSEDPPEISWTCVRDTAQVTFARR